jgi:glycosyltransferase involved in cell wall biosynthesis
MKVVIALASSSGQISGVQRHALNLATCLLSRPEISEVHLVAAPWQQGFLLDTGPSSDARLHRRAAAIGNGTLSRNLWFYAGLPSLAAELKADIVHLAYPVPVNRRAFRCPTVVTLHDLYPYDIPENFGFAKVLFNRAILRQCLSQADAIACVSESTLARLTSLDPRLAASKARLLYNAVQARPQEVEPGFAADQPFLLCVAQHRRNKNILLVLRAFALLLQNAHIPPQTRLLIVGIPGPETPAIQAFIAAHGLSGNVLLLHGIPEAELQWCYRHCRALLAPSITEGFGLPVAEALLAGCRIVCSDIPAFREVGGDGCHFVALGPGEVERFAATVLIALRELLPKPIQLPRFSIPAVAAGCLELYRSVLATSSRLEALPRPPLPATQEGHPRL